MPWIKPGFEDLEKDIQRFREIMSAYEVDEFIHHEEIKALTKRLSVECAIYSIDCLVLHTVCECACNQQEIQDDVVTNASLTLSKLYSHCVQDKKP